MIYRVWNPDECDEEKATRISANHAQHAAEQFADYKYTENETQTEHTVLVRCEDEDGRLKAFEITAAQRWVFHAHELPVGRGLEEVDCG